MASTKNEEKRAIAEKLSEEELAVFDLLTKPEVGLTEKEIEQVKKIRWVSQCALCERGQHQWQRNDENRRNEAHV